MAGAAKARSNPSGSAVQRCLTTQRIRNDVSLDNWRPRRGFQPHGYGLEWYPSRDAALEAQPGRLLVATPYEYEHCGQGGFTSLRQARKYAAFEDYRQFWDTIEGYQTQELPQNLHEVFVEDQPRCLYFDLDGHPSYRSGHKDIIRLLRTFVRWYFSGDRFGWSDLSPEPVVLLSSDPKKYSCHVVFPQIQFENYAQQNEYTTALLAALPAMVLDLEGEESIQILDKLVDRVPYSRFQLLRGPFACKLKDGALQPETLLEPQEYFRNDPLTCFAGYVNPDYTLALPPVQRLLECNEELRQIIEKHSERVTSCQASRLPSLDLTNLLLDNFQTSHTGKLSLAGLTPLQQYEVCLKHLHPDRASHWWSWFRISGITFTLLDKYSHDEEAMQQIWQAHFKWSSQYDWFDEDENVEIVLKARGRSASGMGLLLILVRHDNPGLQVKEYAFEFPRDRVLCGKKRMLRDLDSSA